MKNQKQKSGEVFKTKIGGQAVIEGVMMRGIHKAAMACRLPDGKIDIEEWDIKGGKELPWYRKVPFVRGIFNMFVTLGDGYKCLTRSTEKQMTDQDEEEPTKFEKWLDEKFGDKLWPVLSAISMVLGLCLAMVLFLLLPSFISKLVDKYIISLGVVGKNILEGILKIGIFIAYTALTSLMEDMKRLYRYHGAEHKTITCYEHGEELTPENVKKYTRFHPRCGTSFIFLVLFISIFINTIFRVSWGNIFLRMIIKIALLPVVAGIAYELIRLSGKYDNIFTKIVSAPGLWIQRITTSEPDESMIECAIAALNACRPENKEDVI